MKQEKKILFTGGGTAGHVTPNIALIKKFQQENWEIFYIGSKAGIEKDLTKPLNIKYFGILSGKLRRYFSWENFLDPFKILAGIVQAFFLCLKLKPAVVFSKGGFVAFPVAVAAWLNRIPIIIHESDLSPGLANKLCFPFAKKLCLTFPDSTNYFSSKYKDKLVVTGTPIRDELLKGDANLGRSICNFTKDKKIILVFGGSLGAEPINKAIRKLLPNILEEFQIAHVCGENKIDHSLNFSGYKQFTYLKEEFPHVIAAADLVISRAGANTLYELLALRKPHILIPLGKQASRGDQIENAKNFATKNISIVIFENELTSEFLLQKITFVKNNYNNIIKIMDNFNIPDSIAIIYEIINSLQ
jgi:UDP-N-acetylglucosamine--N-acetylmuramyl-(pentapeptide) pyrophosphoryl-undecaprenol N-acetylglucosamine transferase